MLKYPYFIVVTYIIENGQYYPFVTTCAKVGDKYFKIENLSEFIKDGKSYTDEEIIMNDVKIIQSSMMNFFS